MFFQLEGRNNWSYTPKCSPVKYLAHALNPSNDLVNDTLKIYVSTTLKNKMRNLPGFVLVVCLGFFLGLVQFMYFRSYACTF